MDLQEYIKQMVQQELDEMSVSGDAGGFAGGWYFRGLGIGGRRGRYIDAH